VGHGGAALKWTNEDAVFSLFGAHTTIVDSVATHGDAFLPTGVHRLEVIASGGWTLTISNARSMR
jgi:hypothetical protein